MYMLRYPWAFFRQHDEIERQNREIATLKRKNEELTERLDELRRNIVPLSVPWKENVFFSEEGKTRLLQNINGLVPPQECRDINIFIVGGIATGKSSLVNTLLTVLRNNGQLATTAYSADAYSQSTTPMLHEIVLQNIPGTRKMRVFDCRGIMPASDSRPRRNEVYKEDLKKILDGHVLKDYKFNEDLEIQENSAFYRNNPTISDKMHCVLFVVNANAFDKQTDFSVLLAMKEFLVTRNISLRLVLSHVDALDLCVFGDLTKIFLSRHVQQKVQLAKEMFKLNDSYILPIASYVTGTTQNIAQDILALQAIENIISEAILYIRNQI